MLSFCVSSNFNLSGENSEICKFNNDKVWGKFKDDMCLFLALVKKEEKCFGAHGTRGLLLSLLSPQCPYFRKLALIMTSAHTLNSAAREEIIQLCTLTATLQILEQPSSKYNTLLP